MSTVDPRLNSALPGGFQALDRRLDGGLNPSAPDPLLAELEGVDASLLATDVDVGALLLDAPARGPETFEIADQQAMLAGSDRGTAVDAGVDGVVACFD